jgi:hypothetical protein
MSHFSVLVIGDNPEAQLAPYHEFECTGTNDQYVKDVDITDEIRELMTKPRGYGDRKDEPYDLIGALDYHGLADKVVEDEGDVDRAETHKFGFAVVRKNELIKAINRTNPNRKWDWYQLGGRYNGRLVIKSNRRGVTGKPGLMTDPAPAGRVDQARKQDIDFGRMRSEAAAKARVTHRRFHALIDGIEFPKPWAQVRAEHGEDINAARKAYAEQPAMERIREDDEFRWDDDVALEYGCSEDEYAALAEMRALSTFAVVKGGEWAEQGRMGWFAMVSDEEDEKTWRARVMQAIEEAPDDALISVYDCHI